VCKPKKKAKRKLIRKEPFRLITPQQKRECTEKVEILQFQIADAYKRGDIKAAQRNVEILIRSKASYILAVRKVVTNIGSRTPLRVSLKKHGGPVGMTLLNES